MYGIGVVIGLIQIMAAGMPIMKDVVHLDLVGALIVKKRLKRLLCSINKKITSIQHTLGERGNILTDGVFVYHLIDGITEILDWDKNKIWCRGINSVSQYSLSTEAWKIIYPLTKEQKEWLTQNISQ